jgi:outer membrane receptor protein involved in Fe transport
MRSFNALILSSISLTALTASPAFAQAAAPVDTTPQKTQEGEANPPTSTPTNAEGQSTDKGAIVITGSRIRRNNFNTPQNVDIITRDDQILAGTRSTAETLQSATITSGTSQISGSFLGFLSDNGQAANTVGLRGLGSQRTLVLLNGRRLAPAGVGAQLVAADLNTLPSSIVQRIEVLREGASSIYGSDAIAGVINIITDTSINGITLDAYADHPLVGAGDTLRGSIAAGKTFSRGHIMAAFEVRDDEGMRIGDRKDWSCPRELAFVNGHEVGQLTPDGTQIRCFPYERASIGVPAGYGVTFSFNGAPGTRITFPGYLTGNPTLFGAPADVRPCRNGAPSCLPAERDFTPQPETNPLVLDTTVFSPIRTYTGYLNGAYELGFLGDAELYGEALYVQRKSHQDGVDRPDFQSAPNRFTSAQLYGGFFAYGGTNYPLELFGFPISPFFPVAWANAGYNYFGPFWMPDRTQKTKQKVDFWRANGGIRGSLGIGDWRYDANIQISRTKARDDREVMLTDSVVNTIVVGPVDPNTGLALPAPAGTPSQFITVGLPGQTGAGISYTCASNVTNGAYNGGQCVPINIFDPNLIVYGRMSDALYDYLYETEVYTKTKYKQDTFSFAIDGSVLALQGGDLKVALGAEYRRDHIDDRPGELRRQHIPAPNGIELSGLYRYGPAVRAVGGDRVMEAFGEINAPVFKDKPFFNLLEFDVSGRYTHYKSYGSDFTYHVGAQWAPVRALRFRGNYGTNYRAPNLYEQFADEIGFYPVGFDPCVNFGAQQSPGTTIYNNCLAELTAVLGSQAAALAFDPPGGSIQVITKGGRGNIDSETAKTYGFGAVFTAPRSFADFSLAVDYWHVLVKDEVATLGNNILNFCYQSEDFPNNPYCALIGPRLTIGQVSNPESAGQIGTFDNPFLNVAQQLSAGLDFDARYATRLFGGRFQTQLQATRMLKQKIEFFPGQGLQNFNGTLGYPGFGSGPKWVASLDTRFTTANDITLRWGVKYIGKQNSQATANQLFLTEGDAVCTEGDPGCFPVHYDFTAPPYWEHGASVQWLWRTVGQVTVGVNNIFNKKPPIISDDNVSGFPRIGNYFGNGAYDYRGRSLFVNITRSF